MGFIYFSWINLKTLTDKFIKSTFPLTFNTLYFSHFISKNISTNLGHFLKKKSIDVKKVFNRITNNRFPNFTQSFTDGSKSSTGNCRAGIHIPSLPGQKQCSFKLPSKCTIFTCEAFTTWHALTIIAELGCGPYVIFSDSFSSLNALAHCGLSSSMLNKKMLNINPRQKKEETFLKKSKEERKIKEKKKEGKKKDVERQCSSSPWRDNGSDVAVWAWTTFELGGSPPIVAFSIHSGELKRSAQIGNGHMRALL